MLQNDIMTKASTLPANPFFSGIDIPDKYFCDRKAETAEIIKHIENGSNIVLKAPRRIGKSSLIKHIFAQDEIRTRYNTMYVDIFGTRCLSDFQMELQNSFMSVPFAKGTKLFKKITSYARNAKIELGAVTQEGFKLPSIGIEDPKGPLFSVSEVFDAFEDADKPGIIVFDEFQQIEEYPERMSAILRGLIQQMNNTKFIFSGSSRHILNNMFLNYNQPFYKSATTIDLDIISLPAYREFVSGNFTDYGKKVTNDAIDCLYYLMSGNTFGMQEVMRETFMNTAVGRTTEKKDIRSSLIDILSRRDQEYREILNRISSVKDRNLLFCIAAMGIAKGLTSSATMKRFNLDNASSVQHSLDNLGPNKMNLIQCISKGTYIIQDRLFELWIAYRGNYLDIKLENPKERFEQERAESTSIPVIPAP